MPINATRPTVASRKLFIILFLSIRVGSLLTIGLIGLGSSGGWAAPAYTENPGKEGNGNFQVGPDYKVHPDLTDKGNPKGKYFEFSMPLGFRKGHAAVRNAELQVARERAVLNEQERQVVLDLSNALAEVKRAEKVLETNSSRRIAAKQQLAAIRAIEDPTPQMLYIELDAQRRLADATSQYYRAFVEHEIAVKNVHFEKGSILEYNGIYLAELPSPAKAYQDAFEKIKMRTRASRWAAEGASTRVVSEGLVPQAYAPTNSLPMGPLPPPVGVPTPSGRVEPSP